MLFLVFTSTIFVSSLRKKIENGINQVGLREIGRKKSTIIARLFFGLSKFYGSLALFMCFLRSLKIKQIAIKLDFTRLISNALKP